MQFSSSLKPSLIYVFRINDDAHSGCLKVGETTYDGDLIAGLTPCSPALNECAHKRIHQYTQTAGIVYELLYTELTIFNRAKTICTFNDKEVHNVLLRSGIQRKVFDKKNKANEWFLTDLETVKHAIAAVKEGRQSLSSAEVTTEQSPIIFRPEQQEAIKKTIQRFKHTDRMLWNAKMRFGKTLSALQVVKEQGYTRTLILTHRPVVDASWFDDFPKIFYDQPLYAYGSKNMGDTHETLEQRASKGKGRYVYFASMQDLRGSETVGGSFDKNNAIFATPWDLIIIDEAHEGTQTALGEAVITTLTKSGTKTLLLSGTPFNIMSNYDEKDIYTWDYVMEQTAKMQWDQLHPGDHNPYASLPTMHIWTYNLGTLLGNYAEGEVAFNFREFFRTDANGTFVHHDDVWAFLNLLTKEDADSLYPFANDAYRAIFRHTLWMVPGVKEAKALSAMLKQHPVFAQFDVVNVAGNGDEDEENQEAKRMVDAAIGDDPDQTRTITLSCGRLTTGVSIKPWMAVLMLSGSFNTSPATYMQTIFRVQTPATINGRMKTDCYVFDFAPDRTLNVVARTVKITTKPGRTSGDDRKALGEFLNFCPIIAINGSRMQQYNVSTMLEKLKQVYVERVVDNGFEDENLYSDELFTLDKQQLQDFKELQNIIGSTRAEKKQKPLMLIIKGLQMSNMRNYKS